MASLARRRTENVPGDLFVDETCIDCDTCRWMAPETFDRAGGMSRVHAQPGDAGAERRALMALVACPTASIGTSERHDMKPVLASFPAPVDDAVFHCGYHAEASFGAASWFVRRADGNVLVDSPRFARPLVERLEALGGVRFLFLTHADDVADHEKFAAHFGCERILHEADVTRATRDVERPLAGDAPVALAEDLLLVPTPGHTRGSTCLLFDERVLFSGDHLYWNDRLGHLASTTRYCRYDWDVQRGTVARLADLPFTLLLPGHGRLARFAGDADRRAAIARAVAWMETVSAAA